METDERLAAQKLLQAFVQFRKLNWRRNPLGGISPRDMMLLAHIQRTSTPGLVGIRVTDLRTELHVTGPTMTQQVNDLEARGYVAKHSDSQDRRAVRIQLTQEGEEVVLIAWDAFLRSFEGLVAYLGVDDSNTLATLLGKMYTYFEEVREGEPE